MAVIKCGPLTARRITVNITGDESYDFLPGGQDAPEVTVPGHVVKHPFVQSLVNDGSLIVVDQGDDEDDELTALRAQAEALGIKVDKRWKADRLQSEIESASSKE